MEKDTTPWDQEEEKKITLTELIWEYLDSLHNDQNEAMHKLISAHLSHSPYIKMENQNSQPNTEIPWNNEIEKNVTLPHYIWRYILDLSPSFGIHDDNPSEVISKIADFYLEGAPWVRRRKNEIGFPQKVR